MDLKLMVHYISSLVNRLQSQQDRTLKNKSLHWFCFGSVMEISLAKTHTQFLVWPAVRSSLLWIKHCGYIYHLMVKREYLYTSPTF